MARYAHEGVVHFGNWVDGEDGSLVYFLCQLDKLLHAVALYSYLEPGHDRLPAYVPGLEIFRVDDDVDCMTCLVLEVRHGHEDRTI